MERLDDEASIAGLRTSLVEARERLQAIGVGIRTARDAATSERVRGTQPIELLRPTSELEDLADAVHAHRLALDELERAEH